MGDPQCLLYTGTGMDRLRGTSLCKAGTVISLCQDGKATYGRCGAGPCRTAPALTLETNRMTTTVCHGVSIDLTFLLGKADGHRLLFIYPIKHS